MIGRRASGGGALLLLYYYRYWRDSVVSGYGSTVSFVLRCKSYSNRFVSLPMHTLRSFTSSFSDRLQNAFYSLILNCRFSTPQRFPSRPSLTALQSAGPANSRHTSPGLRWAAALLSRLRRQLQVPLSSRWISRHEACK